MKQGLLNKIDTVVVELNGIEVKGVDNMTKIIIAIQRLSELKTMIDGLPMEKEENGNTTLS